MMRTGLLSLLALAMLAACQTQGANPTPVAVSPSTLVPSAQVTSAPKAFPFDGFNMMDAHSGWAWNGLSQLYRTDDGGTTWMEIHLFGKMVTAGAFYLNADEAWLPGVPGTDVSQAAFHTTDGGKTWTELGRVPGPNAGFYFHDPKVGWALNGQGAAGNIFYQAYQTLDGGQTWTQLQPTSRGGQAPMPNTIHVMTGDSLAFMPPNTIWITSGYGISTPYAGLTVSRDGGKTWREINPMLPADFVTDAPPVVVAAPQFMTGQDAYLPLTAGERLLVFASHNGGESWQLLPPVMQASQMQPRVQFVNSHDGFAVCGSSLCVTHDGAQNWEPVPAPFAFSASPGGSHVLEFDFVDANTGWATVEDQDGRVLFVKTTDGGQTWMNVGPRIGF